MSLGYVRKEHLQEEGDNMGYIQDYIYNKFAARFFDCRIRDLHMRSVFIPSKKIIYFCNPKVAGSSIIQTLLHLDDNIPKWVIHDHNLPVSRQSISSLRDPKLFWECMTDPNAFRFAFVRNPYARILSCYRDKIESGREPRFLTYVGIHDGKKPTFLEFLKRIEQQPVRAMNRHWMPQSALIPKPVDLSMIGRFENIDEHMMTLAEKLGLNSQNLHKMDPHQTKTGNEFQMTCEEFRIVNKIYKEDFKRFSYPLAAE